MLPSGIWNAPLKYNPIIPPSRENYAVYMVGEMGCNHPKYA
jgi:hypothetical protein